MAISVLSVTAIAIRLGHPEFSSLTFMSDTPSLSRHTAQGRSSTAIQDAIDLLNLGQIELEGLLPWSSNYTFLVKIIKGDMQGMAVYKPCKGERPLWDFPSGTLATREVAAYVVSQSLDWPIVPPTILRDGPHGRGMLQLFIDADPEEHYYTFGNDFPDEFKRFALFDILINNADRKAGHCLRDDSDQIWAIDHGVCFHTDPKLRTVIWEFADQSIPENLLEDVTRFCKCLDDASGETRQKLQQLLTRDEIEAIQQRVDRLLTYTRFPKPGGQRHIPWPPV